MTQPIPAHQLCTDCNLAPRALVLGITGYGCLCCDCYNKRMEAAKLKRVPKKPVPGKKREYAWTDTSGWTDEQRHAAGMCHFGCPLCGDLKSNLKNMDL